MSNNETFTLEPKADDIDITVYLGVTVLLFSVGLIGNAFIIMAILSNKNLHETGCAFTFNMAVSDLGVLLLADMLIIVGIATDGKVFLDDPTFCKVSSYFCLALCVVSIWSMSVGSLHTYVRICHRQKYRKIFTHNTWVMACISCWMIGILLLLPTLLGWGSHSYDNILRYCVFDYKRSHSYTLNLVLWGVGLPLCLASYAFTRIAYDVLSSRKRLKRIGSGLETTSRAVCEAEESDDKNPKQPLCGMIKPDDLRLLRSLFFVCVYLGSAWMFLVVIWIYGGSREWTPKQMAFSMTMAHSHCSVNGVLYAVTNKHFRGAFGKIMRGTYGHGKECFITLM